MASQNFVTRPGSQFVQSGTGAVQRTVESKLQDVVSVKDFGAVGDGVADDTAAFSAAAKAAPAANNIAGVRGTMPRAPMCRVRVPAGSYVLTSEVDTGGREVIWELEQAAVISGYDFINGEISRPGQRTNARHHGSLDYACGFSIRSNGDLDDSPEVLGITSPDQLATYTDRDTVGLFVDNIAPAATYDVGTATYTSTTVTLAAPSAAVLRRYRRGMIIDTKHSPKWSGIVDSWNSDGSVLTVTAWYRVGGGGSPGTPGSGTGCVINGFTKAWAHNANVFLSPTSYATRATGFELGVLNNKGPLDFGAQQNYMWGYDAVNLGTYEGAIGFLARGGTSQFFRGFECDNATQVAYHLNGTPGVGFWSEQTAGVPFRYSVAGTTRFEVGSTGSISVPVSNASLSLGIKTAANIPRLDFFSSGNSGNIYDVRFEVSGGTASPGNGLVTLTAGSGLRVAGIVSSTQDNVHSSGTAALRWSVVYAGTGTINTSDEREKQDIAELDAAERRVATALKGLVKKFRFKDAVALKGEEARIHAGVIAQDVVEAFAVEGLDAHRYALLCYDEWEETPEEVNEDGEVVRQYRPAGNRYGIRYEELLAFIVAAL